MPRGGTAIGLAIQTALKSFEASEGRDHVIVLITDGEDTEGDPVGAAEEAAKQGVRIYAIGVGTAEGELIPVRQSDGSTEFLKNKQGEVVKSRLNEEALREIALKTHGMYVRSTPGDFGIDAIYDRGIAGLHRGEYEAPQQRKYFERFQWPLGVAFALLVLESFVSDRRKVA
jgi:Ca-activated chloride channel family protein